MPHIDIGQPDLSRLSVTRDAESTEAGSGLVNGYSLAAGQATSVARDRPTAGVDRTIRVSTAVAVLAVAAIAAYVSYWHAYAVVRAHGESGVTARLEPATIDGLVYASSMVNLYAARHRLPVPALARWLLAVGIIATLAANMAQGWSHGPVGAVIAAWPAVSLVGSYELLVWIIRTAAAGGPDHGPAAARKDWYADHLGADLGSGHGDMGGPGPKNRLAQAGLVPASMGGPEFPARAKGADQARGPGKGPAGHPYEDAGQKPADFGGAPADERDIDVAAVAAYKASLDTGRPLSERKLANMFGKTSRRWARHRIAEARQSQVPA
jgi:Protein of unknown function (DUF2637)